MLNKYCYEALDKCFKDILRFSNAFKPNAPFGGKVVFLEVLRLTENMRLRGCSQDIRDVELKKFADWILNLGDGLLGDSSDDILLHISSADYFKDKSILAPTLDVVTEVNNHVMSLLLGNERVYLSSDTLLNEDGHLESELYTMSTESLNALNCSGIPQHKLVLKIGVPVMLLRNIDQSNGLCNGTWMQVRRLGDHVIECVILAGRNVCKVVLIPRMNMIPNNETLLIRFIRRQFPIMLCFAMAINKSQGQTLSTVGVYLSRPVFTHDQLCVALFRVNSMSGLKILIIDSNGTASNHTLNIVYRKVFVNLFSPLQSLL
ncbi:uncharacterized protein LOC107633151 isoform X1 [Arachis ipaensis]|uniref:uncharacterized protein LOC107633151 isoform X1 n=1 Tax=Arachis ipaensis TaxID=130454 RepID=UPI000A2B7B3B|nr:uncharacterized protein LOC107633151 isoform X1 [Arachis ipaensis]